MKILNKLYKIVHFKNISEKTDLEKEICASENFRFFFFFFSLKKQTKALISPFFISHPFLF